MTAQQTTPGRPAYLFAALAVLTCPCHLPIWVAALSGTAAGALLSAHVGLALAALALLFILFLVAAIGTWHKPGETDT